MKMVSLILCFILNASLVVAAEKTPIPLKTALQNIGLQAGSGILVQGDSCSATYEVDSSLEKLVVTVKTVEGNQERTASATFGPQVYYGPFFSSFELSATDSNSNLGYSSRSKEVRIANIYLDEKTAVTCMTTSGPSENENRAIKVNLTSNGASFDMNAENAFYAYVGARVADQSLEQFKVTSYGDEGGKFYCLEISRAYYGLKLEKLKALLTKELKERVVPASGTTFSLKQTKSCE